MFVDEAGSTRPGFISFPPRFGPGLPAEKRQCSGLRSTMATSLPSVAPVRAEKLNMRVFEQSISGEEVA
jgi:hypothetical protein